jgi:hypothetical protein
MSAAKAVKAARAAGIHFEIVGDDLQLEGFFPVRPSQTVSYWSAHVGPGRCTNLRQWYEQKQAPTGSCSGHQSQVAES